MPNAIKRATYTMIVLTLFGCYTEIRRVPADGSHPSDTGVDSAPNVFLDSGAVSVGIDTGYDVVGIAVDAPLGSQSGDSGRGGAPIDSATTGTGGVAGTLGSGGAPGTGGAVGDAPASAGPEVGPEVPPVSCSVGYYVCNGTCVASSAPCAGICPTGRKYCAGANTCVPASGCCSATDCPVAGANTVATCTSEVCGISCSSAKLTLCGDACVDLLADPVNCRTCGNKCGAGAPRCSAGSCVQCTAAADCGGNRACSGNQCVCPNTDGACGATCTPCVTPAPRCQAGACVGCISVDDCPSGYSCVGNQCKAPLQCGDALPVVTFPTVFVAAGTPPLPVGGAITEGVYATTKVTCYGPDYSSVSGDAFELRSGRIHRRHVTYALSGSAMSGYEETGTYAASGAAMAVDVVLCGTSMGGQSLWKYTASSTQIETFTGAGSDTCIQTFALQK